MLHQLKNVTRSIKAKVIGSHVTNGKDKCGKAFSRSTVWNDTYMEREGKWQCITFVSTTVVPEKK